ncbi:hypothetical protein ACMATS_35925 [Streptoverticillium reticulum]|uniref:hypothetical protein n=1 Tax=Streptoverticillium reticulum TaxID=1433415 RepID=UPI0039BF55CE
MSSRRRRPLAALVAALASVLLMVPPAVAAPAGPGTGPGPGPGEKIADALRDSPVYVDAAYTGAVPAARQKDLVEHIRRTRLPIEVALVPLAKGDAFDGDPQVLADVLHDRLGSQEIVLITLDRWADALSGHEWPDDRHQARDAVAAVGFLAPMKDAGLADRLDKAVDLIAQGDGTKVYHDATAGLDKGTGGSTGASGKPAAKDKAASGGGAWLPITAAIAVPALCALWLVRRRARRRQASPFTFPQAVFAAHRAADEDALRHRAEQEVLALGEAVQARDADTAPGLPQALDAYAAAGTVLDGARGLPDLAGVLALTALGRDALRGNPIALPLCFFHPVHGRAERRITWRPLGRRDQLDVAACRNCAQAVRARRAPEVLTDCTPDGRRVPYFELPADASVWAATGYGSLVAPGGALGMTERILNGDFTRSRNRRH